MLFLSDKLITSKVSVDLIKQKHSNTKITLKQIYILAAFIYVSKTVRK